MPAMANANLAQLVAPSAGAEIDRMVRTIVRYVSSNDS